jgi:hypothetical protein
LLTPPRSRIVVAGDVQTGSKLREDSRWKALGEDIGILRAGGYVKDLDMTESNLIADEVEINLYVLRALMLDWVAGHVDGADVITEDHCSSAERSVKLQKELAKPGSLSHGICNSTILGLGTGAGEGRLAFGGRGNEVGTEEHCITGCGFASVRADGPVSIGVDNQIVNTGRAEVQA